VHVIERLWKASRALEESTELQKQWVGERLLRILQGKVRTVARGMKQSATKRRLSKSRRKNVDACAKYLRNNARIADYRLAFEIGAPIATGVIEGTCRHLVGERMDISGARWSLDMGEAVLRLRALLQSGDFDEYWVFHEQREHERNHKQRYKNGNIPPPQAETQATAGLNRHLQLLN